MYKFSPLKISINICGDNFLKPPTTIRKEEGITEAKVDGIREEA